ncbi:hypothetical protein JCM8097_008643 [Rhodosporidiobolus ruineniae]
MSASTPQPCVVCFKPAVSRCAPCLARGIDLSFCSKECQKLVWSTHKRVCGGPSPIYCNPFYHPPLTRDEADEAKRTKHFVVYPKDKVELLKKMGGAHLPLCPWDGFRTGFLAGTLKEDDFETVLDSLIFDPNQPNYAQVFPGQLISPLQLMRTVRKYRCQNALGVPFFEPFPLLAQFEANLTSSSHGQGEGPLITHEAPWYSAVCHRALCFFASMQKLSQQLGGPPSKSFKELCRLRSQAWSASLAAYVRTKDPKAVEHIEVAAGQAYDAMCGV